VRPSWPGTFQYNLNSGYVPGTNEQFSSELRRLHEYQRAVAAFARAASEIPIRRLMQHMTAQISLVTHIGHVKVLRYRPDRGDLLLEAGVGWKAGLIGKLTLPTDRASPPGRTIQTGASVAIEDLPNDPEYRYHPALRDHGIVSLLNVPIRVGNRTWGVLEVDSNIRRTFDEDDDTFLTVMAKVLGLALLGEESRKASEELAAQHSRERRIAEMHFREFQHRVKNNLQLIVSLLSLQRRQLIASGAGGEEQLAGVIDRVQAIALAQDQLSFQGGNDRVEFGNYLRALCSNINPLREFIVIEIAVVPGLMLPLDRAVSIGLVVNELVTNALKHAFDESGGTIWVSFERLPQTGEAELVVEDNGRGMAATAGGGLGFTLVDGLVRQLRGQMEHQPVSKGTRIRVHFPLAI